MTSYVFHADINKFDAKATRYNGENALLLADCAKLVYEPESDIRQVMEEAWKFGKFEFFDKNGTQGFVAGNEASIIVAFRGTEIKKIRDVVADARVIPTTGSIGTVHRGFNDALHQVWGSHASKDMRQTIKKFQDNKQTIWICGHSLGGALAALAAAEYIINDKGTVNGLYTIGQPRIGNAEFAARFEKALPNNYYRFVNNNDIVPRVPLSLPAFKYAHAGRELYIDSKGQLQDSMPWWKLVWDRLSGAYDDLGKLGPDDLKDHFSKNYVELIAKNRSVKTQWS